MVARALALVEEHLQKPAHDTFRLVAGTSTGAIIAACIAAGVSAQKIHELYRELGCTVFRKSVRRWLWWLGLPRYRHGPLEAALKEQLGDVTMGDLGTATPAIDVVITMFDLVKNRTRFVKPWKEEYSTWPVIKAVLASCSVPTYFPPVEGRYVDGGVGSYSNPCYLAAYELALCLEWNPAETTLISLGTGRDPRTFRPGDADHLWVKKWLERVLGAFLQSADDQQVRLVRTFFEQLDFRRFQVDLDERIRMDDASAIADLDEYGRKLAEKILRDETDPAQSIDAGTAPDSFENALRAQ